MNRTASGAISHACLDGKNEISKEKIITIDNIVSYLTPMKTVFSPPKCREPISNRFRRVLFSLQDPSGGPFSEAQTKRRQTERSPLAGESRLWSAGLSGLWGRGRGWDSRVLGARHCVDISRALYHGPLGSFPDIVSRFFSASYYCKRSFFSAIWSLFCCLSHILWCLQSTCWWNNLPDHSYLLFMHHKLRTNEKI